MKTKSFLLLILTFGFVFTASAEITCEPLGYSWFCEDQNAQNAQSFSWSTGSTTPFTFVNCGFANGNKYVSLTITHTNGSTSTQTKVFHCGSSVF